jgi:hypothetical protein
MPRENKEKEFEGSFSHGNERPVRRMLSSVQIVISSLEYMTDEELKRFHTVMSALYDQEQMLVEPERSVRLGNTYSRLTTIAEYLLREPRWDEVVAPDPDPFEGVVSWRANIEDVGIVELPMPPDTLHYATHGVASDVRDGNNYIDLTDPDLPHLLVGLRSAGPPYTLYAKAIEGAVQVGADRAISYERWFEQMSYTGGQSNGS